MKKIFILLLLSLPAFGQAWSPFLSFVPPGQKNVADSAIDWTLTGLPTTDHLPPDGHFSGADTWTQCGSTILASACSNGASDCTSTIQSALNSCTANHYVLLGPGTFLLSSSSPITLTVNKTALRGSGATGASETLLNITSNIQDGTIRLGGSGDPNTANTVNITSGATAQSTSIVVSSATNIHVGDDLWIHELNDYSFVSTPIGSATSTTETSLLNICPSGSINASSSTFTCSTSVFTSQMVGQGIQVPGAGSAGATLAATISSQAGTTAVLSVAASTTVNPAVLAYAGSPSEGAGGVNYCDGDFSGTRCRMQTVVVTNVAGTTITFTPPLYTDYTLTPEATPFTPTVNVGVEDLQVTENSTHTNRDAPIGFNKCDQCWTGGIYNYFSDGDYAKFYWSTRSAYFDNVDDSGDNHGPGSDNQSVLLAWGSSANQIFNNIFIRQENDVLFYLGASGNVIAYNYSTGGYGSPSDIIVGMEGHSSFTQFQLFEGNIGGQLWYDVGHGANGMHTSFRNWWEGTNLFCGNANTKTPITCSPGAWNFEYNVALRIDSLSWNINSIGDIVGSPAMEGLGGSKFAVKAWPTSRNTGGSGDDKIELSFGYTLQSDTGTNPFDSTIAQSQALIHGLYSNHAGTITWSGSLTHTLPASFFLNSKPPWWSNSLPWPGIGPDISGGTIPAAATAGPSPGGHVNMNPAMNCFYNVMGGKEGGDGSPYAYNWAACYSPTASTTPMIIGPGIQLSGGIEITKLLRPKHK